MSPAQGHMRKDTAGPSVDRRPNRQTALQERDTRSGLDPRHDHDLRASSCSTLVSPAQSDRPSTAGYPTGLPLGQSPNCAKRSLRLTFEKRCPRPHSSPGSRLSDNPATSFRARSLPRNAFVDSITRLARVPRDICRRTNNGHATGIRVNAPAVSGGRVRGSLERETEGGHAAGAVATPGKPGRQHRAPRGTRDPGWGDADRKTSRGRARTTPALCPRGDGGGSPNADPGQSGSAP